MKKTIAIALCAVMLETVCALWQGMTAQAEGKEILFGTYDYASAVSGGGVGDSYYYSDEWFLESPEERNDALALVSAQLAAASDGAQTAELLRKLGFSDVVQARFDSEDARDCAYVTGIKAVKAHDGKRTVRAVVFQGHSYGAKGWLQNVTVNPEEGVSEEHAAYAEAARIFLEDYDAMPGEENGIVWLCGLSRGGAVANVVSAYLLEREDAPELVCFTFEAPATTQRDDAQGGKYLCIYNYLSDDDPVTMIPMWGMKRFGTEIRIDTETPEELGSVLEKTNPDAALYAEEAYANAPEDGIGPILTGIIGQLTLTIPEREEYSAVHTVSLGEEETFTYTFQDGLKAICRMMLEGNGGGLGSLSDLYGCLPDIVWSYLAEAWAEENDAPDSAKLLMKAAKTRWVAAELGLELLPEEIAKNLRKEDLYAIFRLLSPMLVNRSMMTRGWELPEREGIDGTGFMDLSELIRVWASSSRLILSHQPDVILARMKLLAPAPAFKEYSLKITDPSAGDSVLAAPDEIFAQSGSEDWLRISKAEWLSGGDEQLIDDSIHYLHAAAASVGHLVPDDFRFTINGAEPDVQEIRHENGICVIDGVWSFRIGEPAEAAVRFDAAGHGETPEAYAVEAGTMLRYAQYQPVDPGTVSDGEGTWDFDGWTDDEGNDWKDLIVREDVTLRAGWKQVIDDIDLTFAIPRRGDRMEDALLGVALPEGMPLEFNGISIVDEKTWEPMEVIGDEDEYLLMVFIKPEKGYRFLSAITEDGDSIYTGSVTINGVPLDSVSLSCEIDGDEIIWSLMCEYSFRPEEAEREGYVFNPHLYVPILDGDVPQEYWDSFYNLCDALRAGETTFACASMEAYKWATDPVTLTELFPPACTKIEGESRDGSVPFENGIGKIFYQMPAEEYVERQARFEALVVDVLNTCLEPDDDAFEKCLKLFDYMSANYSYQYDFQAQMSDGANYLAYTTGKGQCIELASVYAYYLLQAGVEALQVGCNNPEMAHAWTYTVIDGRGYHTDPTWSLREPEAGEELGLYYFLMTDERRKDSGCAVDDLTVPLLPRYWANFSAAEFTASDDRYCFPEGSFLMSIDEDGKTVHYTCYGEEYDLCYAQE